MPLVRLTSSFARRRMLWIGGMVLFAYVIVLALASTHAAAAPLQPKVPAHDQRSIPTSHTPDVHTLVTSKLQAAAWLASKELKAPVSSLAATVAFTPTFTPLYLNGVNRTNSIALGDVNGDGALDVIQGNQAQPSVVYLNDGHGGFGAGVPFGGANFATSIALGDVNGDGALDIVQGNPGQPSVVYLNDGHGGFGTGVTFGVTNTTTSIALADVNGDGALDIVQGNGDYSTLQQSYVYLNDGHGNFGAGVPFGGMNSTTSIALGDVNGDGALDIVQGNGGYSNPQQSYVYLNDGHGNFGAGVPFGGMNSTTSIALGDVNGDGALDVVQGNDDPFNLQPSVVYLNDGHGAFGGAGVPFGGANRTGSIALGDVNGDGALDILQGNGDDVVPQHSMVYLNDGHGAFGGAGVPLGITNETRSIALGDVNGDGALDIVQGNFDQQSVIFVNDRQGGFSAGVPFGDLSGTSFIALGDVNGDGALDIVSKGQAYFQQSAVFLNDGHGNFGAGAQFGSGQNANGIALGDMNGDGALDIVQSNEGLGYVHLNDGAGHFSTDQENCNNPPSTLRCFGTNSDIASSVALGDVNGDGSLDIVQGNANQQSKVYLNDGRGNFGAGVPFGGAYWTTSIALGDVNGDGALDIVQGINDYFNPQPSRVYLNDGHGNFGAGVPLGGPNRTSSIALGDVNGDGALDIIQGNYNQQSMVYLNDGHGGFGAGVPFGVANSTNSIALGDVNGDGALDIIQGNGAGGEFSQPNMVYYNSWFRNVGLSNNPPRVSVTRPITTANADFFSTPQILGSSTIPLTYTLFDPEGDPVRLLRASYSPDGGGKWYTATAASGTPTTSLTTRRYWNATYLTPTIALPDNSVFTSTLMLTATSPLTVTDVKVWVAISHTQASDLRMILQAPTGVTVTLFNTGTLPGPLSQTLMFANDPTLTSILAATAPYSGAYQPAGDLTRFEGLNASGQWQLRVEDRAPGNTGTLNAWGLQVQDSGGMHVYKWDTFASGFFGKSDDVVFRLEAYPSLSSRPNGVPVFQHPFVSATTFPFRVRGTQVRVLSGTVPISDALVYRLPAGQTVGALPFAESSGVPFLTDNQGYLQGRGQLGFGDQLVALYPITATKSYTLYDLSAAPTPNGLNMYTVTHAGVQTLTVSARNPLVLFNLSVSLEWDARQDTQYLAQLDYDLQRTSDFLFRWTNGQAALGNITLYHNRQQWWTSDVQIYATNRLRPYASVGGLVSGTITEVVTPPLSASTVLTYTPGRVHMGAVWNHFGSAVGTPGQDWPRALAHELGHYLFFQNDDYLGLQHGLVASLDSCTDTVMTDPYRDDYAHFHIDGPTWQSNCATTLANRETGRSDWATIKKFYPWLTAVLTTAIEGPSSMPLAVTQIVPVLPITPSVALPVPVFALLENGSAVQPGPSAQAFLYQGDRLIDLGGPTQDKVNARGAKAGDRLCVYELAASRLGCETIQASTPQLALITRPDWQPQVRVTPINSTTVNVQVTGLPAGLSLKARLYPIGSLASPTIALSAPVYSHNVYLPLVMRSGSGGGGAGYTYVGTFDLDIPALEAYVQVWVDGPDPRREIITSYALGGNPAPEGNVGYSPEGNVGYAPEGNVGYAPGTSSDGQVLLFGGANFPLGEFTTLQAATVLPAAPPGRTPVGQGYWLSASAGAPSLNGNGFSINFRYLQNQVPAGEEGYLKVYRWDGAQWSALPTQLDLLRHYAFAPTQGAGLYLLMSGIEIPLYGPGWNMIQYPAQGTKPVTAALASISGSYSMVYGSVVTDTLDPWKLYAIGVPAWVNDLATLSFAQSYWISATRSITLEVTGGASAPASLENLPSPPMTVYGELLAGSGVTPVAGMTVTALVNGMQCGQGTTKVVNSQVVYTLNIQPDAPGGKAGCGAAGRTVTFKIGAQALSTSIEWNIDRVWNLPLLP